MKITKKYLHKFIQDKLDELNMNLIVTEIYTNTNSGGIEKYNFSSKTVIVTKNKDIDFIIHPILCMYYLYELTDMINNGGELKITNGTGIYIGDLELKCVIYG